MGCRSSSTCESSERRYLSRHAYWFAYLRGKINSFSRIDEDILSLGGWRYASYIRLDSDEYRQQTGVISSTLPHPSSCGPYLSTASLFERVESSDLPAPTIRSAHSEHVSECAHMEKCGRE